jgi:hypothetical protein
MTGTKSVTRSGTWKSTGKATSKAVKKLIPHAAKLGKNSSGFNLGYYREAYFALEEEKQYNLFMSGFAPKMTRREVHKLRSTFCDSVPTRTYKPQTVMYDAHISPAGYEAPLKDLVAEAAAAKRHAIEMAKQRRARQLGRGDDREQGELAAQAADLRAARHDRVRREDGGDAERQQDEQGRARGGAAVGRGGECRGDRGGHNCEREAAAHGVNRYPTPQTVSMCRGWDGSGSIFVRSRRMWTVTVDVSV